MLTTDQIAADRENGFVLVDGLMTPAEVAPALAAMEQYLHGQPFASADR